MGYPMTFRRVLHRNGFVDGDYTDPPERHRLRVNIDEPGLMTKANGDPAFADDAEFFVAMGSIWRERLKTYDTALRALSGDLRRLEQDTVDEGSLCQQIVLRTGIDADTVAAVLAEFMAI